MDLPGTGSPVCQPAPRRATVLPRVCKEAGGAALPLEQHIRRLLDSGARGVVGLCGPPGSGKSTALAHVAAVLPSAAPVSFIDGRVAPRALAPDRLVLQTCCDLPDSRDLCALFDMAPWTEDDCVQYLATVHRERCASVLARIRRSKNLEALRGLPELWHIVLDVMAADESVRDIESALLWHVAMELPDEAGRRHAGSVCVNCQAVRDRNPGFLSTTSFNDRVARLLRHQAVQLPLAAEELLIRLENADDHRLPTRMLPIELIERTGQMAFGRPRVREALESIIEGQAKGCQSLAASILTAMTNDWRPRDGSSPNFGRAILRGVKWDGLCLAGADFTAADLQEADLCHAALHDLSAQFVNLTRASCSSAWLRRAGFRCAVLKSADLTDSAAMRCDFASADLESANLSRADLRHSKFVRSNLNRTKFVEANLRKAVIARSELNEASFRRADLRQARLIRLRMNGADWSRARFRNAILIRCDLENLELPGASFSGADFRNCLLTDSFMPGANFRGAILRGAGLAGIDWAGADLRNADLRCATFHLGSSRSGLVGSTVPCEGSKTGFYTDDFEDQHYKRPEEIRKANLCGADLRGAIIDGVDFYLVDLRGARYTKKQAEHLLRCGAILGSVR